jgi:ceramide synthetase
MRPLSIEKNDLNVIEYRTSKKAFNKYRAIYFGFVSVYGYLVLKDTQDLPNFLGGSGDISNWFKDYPYREVSTDVKTYMVFTMGYHVSNLILLAAKERKVDFVEMMFHHIVTVFLFGGSFMINFVPIGAVVAFLHDTADFICAVLKISAETEYDNMTKVSFVVLMTTWVYTRLLVFPYLILSHEHSHLDEETLFFHYILQFACYALDLLHFVWFV